MEAFYISAITIILEHSLEHHASSLARVVEFHKRKHFGTTVPVLNINKYKYNETSK